MSTEAPSILRCHAVERLLAHHRSTHGVARIIGERGEGLPLRINDQRLATLQASGPRDAVKALHLALDAVLEAERLQMDRQRRVSERIVGLTRRLRELEERMLGSLEERKRQLVRQSRRLADVAATDPLTDTLNRRAFDLRFQQVAEVSASSGDPMAVLFFDLDNFKMVNDTHGHAVGDRVLTEVAGVLSMGRRKGDLVARWGGEEFVVVLPDCEKRLAMTIAERLRCGVKALSFSGQEDFKVTISVGVVAGVPRLETLQQDATALVQTADERLYDAKQLGRDRVVGSAEALRLAG